MTEPTRVELLLAGALKAIEPDEVARSADHIAALLRNPACNGHSWAQKHFQAARALLGDEWQPISTAPKVAGRIEVRSVITYRWLPYKPQSEQAKRGIKGRWQFPTSDYGGWTNGELPHNAEWRPLPAPPQGGDRADKEHRT